MNDLARHQGDFNAVNAQLSAIPPAIHQTLNVKK